MKAPVATDRVREQSWLGAIAQAIKSATLPDVVRFTCGAGVVHFGISVFLWAFALGAALLMTHRDRHPIYWPALIPSIPAFVLLIGFIFAFRLSRARPRAAGLFLLLLLAVSSVVFSYDMVHDRYQIQTFGGKRGCSHFYATWFWWEYDR